DPSPGRDATPSPWLANLIGGLQKHSKPERTNMGSRVEPTWRPFSPMRSTSASSPPIFPKSMSPRRHCPGKPPSTLKSVPAATRRLSRQYSGGRHHEPNPKGLVLVFKDEFRIPHTRLHKQ